MCQVPYPPEHHRMQGRLTLKVTADGEGHQCSEETSTRICQQMQKERAGRLRGIADVTESDAGFLTSGRDIDGGSQYRRQGREGRHGEVPDHPSSMGGRPSARTTPRLGHQQYLKGPLIPSSKASKAGKIRCGAQVRRAKEILGRERQARTNVSWI